VKYRDRQSSRKHRHELKRAARRRREIARKRGVYELRGEDAGEGRIRIRKVYLYSKTLRTAAP